MILNSQNQGHRTTAGTRPPQGRNRTIYNLIFSGKQTCKSCKICQKNYQKPNRRNCDRQRQRGVKE